MCSFANDVSRARHGMRIAREASRPSMDMMANHSLFENMSQETLQRMNGESQIQRTKGNNWRGKGQGNL